MVSYRGGATEGVYSLLISRTAAGEVATAGGKEGTGGCVVEVPVRLVDDTETIAGDFDDSGTSGGR